MKLLLLLSALTLRPARLQTIRPMVNDGASVIDDICEDHNTNITLTIRCGLSAAQNRVFLSRLQIGRPLRVFQWLLALFSVSV